MPYEKHILASLLFAFSFIVMHDFIIAGIDPDAQSPVYSYQTEQTSQDVTVTLHENIHHSLEVVSDLPASIVLLNQPAETFEEISLFIATSSITLDRPPTVYSS